MANDAMIFPNPEACQKNTILARLIAGWLAQLAQLLASKEGRIDKNTIGGYSEMLIRDFDAKVFTSETLHEVCSQFTWWPSYPALRHVLAEWRKAHDMPKLLPGEQRQSNLTSEEKGLIKIFYQDESAAWREKDEVQVPDITIQRRRRARSLSILKRYAFGAYQFVTKNNPSLLNSDPIDVWENEAYKQEAKR